MSTRQAKARLRVRFKRARARHLGHAPALSARICAHLAGLEAKVIAVFASHEGEPDLADVVDIWLSQGRTVLYPRVTGPGQMELCRVGARSELYPGKFGILEPLGARFDGDVEVVLVPGLAFDLHGHRLGFGAGFYDRFLGRDSEVVAIGVAFDWQVVSRLPSEPHDRPVSAVLTDRRVYGESLVLEE